MYMYMPSSTLKQVWSHTDQLQTVHKMLQAKDTELQAKETLTKGSEGEAFCEDLYLYVQVYTLIQ